MAKLKDYPDRRSDAANAKAALLEKFKTASVAPELAAKLAARAEVARERDERREEREAVKLAEQQLATAQAAAVAEEEMRQQAVEAAIVEAHKTAQDRRIALVLSDEAARKAARDQRYAKRKAVQTAA